MDILLEILVEVILEGLLAFLESDKVPKWFRFIIYLLISAMILAFALLMFSIAFKAEILFLIMFLAFGFFFVGVWVYITYQLKNGNKLSTYE